MSQQYPPETARGGIGTQTWNKARELAAIDHEVHVLAAAPTPELISSEMRDGVALHRVPPPNSDPPIHTEPGYWLAYSWSVRAKLRDLIDMHAFDVVDFPDYGAEGFAYQLGRSEDDDTPIAVQLHAPLALLAARIGWPERPGRFYHAGDLMEGASISGADALMACSANIADFVADHYGIRRELIDVVHTGVDTEAFRPGEESNAGDRAPTVLFVGNIAPNKGIVELVEAVLLLRRRIPDLRLEIVGRGSEQLVRRLEARVEEASADPAVRFRGFLSREELPAVYAAADVFCSVAAHEGGVANVYLEAMASGTPVVAGSEGGAPEAVIHGETGLIVMPGDVAATAEAIRTIVEDPALHRAMARAGRRHVEDYFAMDKYIQRVLAVYRRAIGVSADRSRFRSVGAGGDC